MPYFERRRCQFTVTRSGDGSPSMIHIEFLADEPSLLEHKQIGSIFLGLTDFGRDHADQLEAELNKMIARFCVRHEAAGE
jgi:hypothetical protein